MSANSVSIEFTEVVKSFGQRRVLDSITTTIAAGKTTAIVGESGCGKSTLLEHINGLLRPDAGSVRVGGANIDYQDLQPLRRSIGYAVQAIALFPHITVARNVALLAHLEGWSDSRIAQRQTHLFELMGLPKSLLSRYPYQLSGGQQQRVGLCRAMMLSPPVLLLDEPFSGVDPITRRDIHLRFLELAAEERPTVVLVTHDLREAKKLGHTLIIMRAGQLIQQGAMEQVLAAPANTYIELLLQEQL